MLLRTGGAVLAARLLQALANAAVGWLVARELGPAGQGRYALTLLLAPLDGWRPDPVRYQPDPAERRAFFERCLEVYPADRRLILRDADPAVRTRRAVEAVGALLSPPG